MPARAAAVRSIPNWSRVGVRVPWRAAPLDPWYYLAAFVLFRLCDITKPWPANWAERRFTGGLGIMADDIMAALYGVAAIAAFRIWF